MTVFTVTRVQNGWIYDYTDIDGSFQRIVFQDPTSTAIPRGKAESFRSMVGVISHDFEIADPYGVQVRDD